MAVTMSRAGTLAAPAAGMASAAVARPPIPTTRSVPSLEAALRDVRRYGGTVTSETRTAPGIGCWAFVTDAKGAELCLWEDASAIRS